jgi:DNA topoisomerase-1
MYLVVVESPAKAKTINKYLGASYSVIASYGHIRDLPSKNGSVNPDDDFAMVYEISEKSKKHVKSIAALAKKASKIYLATDQDREGEAISWHIVEALKEEKALKKNVEVKRVVFNEITKTAILHAIENPRDLDMNLINAQQARRALDYLVGFNLSPILWRKLPGSKSAGRVQSVALRIICEREHEIKLFVAKEYWDIKLSLQNKEKAKIVATLTHVDGKKLDKFDIADEKKSTQLVKLLADKKYHVADIEKKQISRNPQSPFTTSSLQQEASRKLGFSTKYTMQVAQKLYEGVEIDGESVGLITYMRTDSVHLSNEAIKDIRDLIKEEYGPKYLPKSPRAYKSKAKNAQEAHEAIRPTAIKAYTPQKLAATLDKDMLRLYELIWKRTLASQMENALLDQVAIIIEAHDKAAAARATGSTLVFDGFYKLYRESLDDEVDEEDKILPKCEKGEDLALLKLLPEQHFTQSPPRYSEASLVKKLEELGIGRPSTYASIISVLQERNYVKLEKKRFMPEDRGMIVTSFLTNFFKRYVEYDFTALLENQLDEVSAGELAWKKMLGNFWGDFIQNVQTTGNTPNPEILEAINTSLERHFFVADEHGDIDKTCPSCQKGTLSIKLGKYGAFFACSMYPDCNYTKPITDNDNSSDPTDEAENKFLGIDEQSGQEINLKKGPYGYYVQKGEGETNAKGKKLKPKRCSIPAFIELASVDLQKAQQLLALPIVIGHHPETNLEIKMSIGKFGPYILHNDVYVSIKKDESIFNLSVAEAVQLIAQKASKTPAAKATKEALLVVGQHPDDKEQIAIYDGKFGPYLKYKKMNIAITKKYTPEDITMPLAIELIKKHLAKKG